MSDGEPLITVWASCRGIFELEGKVVQCGSYRYPRQRCKAQLVPLKPPRGWRTEAQSGMVNAKSDQNCRLIERRSRAPCTRFSSFDCKLPADGGEPSITVWASCRGIFELEGKVVQCGSYRYPQERCTAPLVPQLSPLRIRELRRRNYWRPAGGLAERVIRVNQQDLPLQRSAHVVVAQQRLYKAIECGHKYCPVRLVEQTSRARCIPGITFGCHDGERQQFWTRNCRGIFRCQNGHEVRCGYPAGAASYNCSCNSTNLVPAGYLVACNTSTAIAKREAAARVETRTFALPKVALYTVVTGAYEKTVPYSCREAYGRGTPIAQSFNVVCYLVTDSDKMAQAASRMGWSPIRLRTSRHPKRQQRETKIVGFAQAELAVLKTYEYVLYHDGHRGPRVHGVHKKLEVFPAETWQCWLHKVISETLQPLLEQRADIVYFGHPNRNTTHEEAVEVRKMKLCSSASLDGVAQLHKTRGYPDNMGLAETAVLARRWNSPTLQQAMHGWWDAMVQTNCMRDQLNFEFALWKHKVKSVRKENLDFPFIKLHKHSDPRAIRHRSDARRA